MRDGAILIVTRKFDPHADHVIGILNRRGIPFFRLNTDDFHADIAIEASGNDGIIRLSDRWGRTHRFPNRPDPSGIASRSIPHRPTASTIQPHAR